MRHVSIIAVMAFMYINWREIDVTALMDGSAVMYTSDMAEAPDVPDDVKIADARNDFAAIIEKARYFGGVTFLTNRGKRVAAVVSVEDAQRILDARETED